MNGPTSGTRADDRIAEFGTGPLRRCKFAPTDARFLRDCKQCLLDAGKQDIQENITSVFAGSHLIFTSTPLYDMNKDAGFYSGVPLRAKICCD